MKKLLLLALVAGIASTSHALTWNFTTATVDAPPLKKLDGAIGSSSSYYRSNSTTNSATRFNLLSDGYDPATMVVTSATVTFWFADDDSDGAEYVDIFVNGTNTTGTKVISDQEVGGSHPASNFAPYSANLQDFGGLIAALQDGIMEYEVRLTTGGSGNSVGDTWLKIATISATGTYRTPPPPPGVPDGGTTAVMLGASLIALAALRRRFSR